MKNVMGCLTAENWWADRRTRWRVIVLVIVLVGSGWLVEAQHLSVLEAGGALALLGLVAGLVIDWVVDGHRPAQATMIALAGAATPPAADASGGNQQSTGRP